MAFGEDWLGWTIFVFIIVTIIIIVIKMLIEYPGLTELKCVYKDKDSADNDDLESIGEYYQEKKKSKVIHKISRRMSIVQDDDEETHFKLEQNELRNSNMSEDGEHEDKQNDERVEVIEFTFIDDEIDKVTIDVINEKHFTVATIESPNLHLYKTDLLLTG